MIRSTALFLVVATATAAVASRAAETAGRVKVIEVPGASKMFKAQTGKDGTIHLLFDSDDGPQYISSRDGAATFSKPIGVVDAASRKPGLKFNAWDLAVAPDGRVHVAMGNNAWKLKLPKEEWAFYYASLAPGSKEFSPTRNINRKSSEGFSLAAGSGRRSHSQLSLRQALHDVFARQWRNFFRELGNQCGVEPVRLLHHRHHLRQ